MEFLFAALDFFLHLDDHLHRLILEYGIWIYLILFLIIFVETGLVVMPFLPGDSLLFAAGTFCSGKVNELGETASLNIFLLLGLLLTAAISGDALNYYLGKKIGLRVLKMKIGSRQLVSQKNINKTNQFYEKHGPKTIIIARFVPIVRTFAPFVAGIGDMKYSKFLQYNVIGAVIWVVGVTLLGYFFGKLPIIQENFEIVIFGIIAMSAVPYIIDFFVWLFKRKKKNAEL
jgi:membrane-associated protein